MAGYPSLPLFVREYLVDTTHLTIDQSGAYLHLLMHAWVKGGTLPDDEKQLAAMAKCTVKKWRSIRAAIEDFWIIENGTWVNKRLSRELQFVRGKIEKRSAAGKRGGRPRNEEKQSLNESNAFEEESKPKAPTLTPTLKRKIPKEKTDSLLMVFRKSTAFVFGGEHVPAFFPSQTDRLMAEQMAAKGITPDQLQKAVRSAQEGRNRAGSTPISSLKYFEFLLNEPDRESPSGPDDLWAARLETFRKKGLWFEDIYGPRPGQPGCEVPEEYLAERVQ